MKALLIVGFVCACAAKPVMVSPELLSCDLSDHTPRVPPKLRTPMVLAQYANAVELSREAIIQERNDCDNKRKEILRRYVRNN